jgi:hypothetical protein
MSLNDLADRVLKAIKGDKEAIKKISEALAGRDPARIKQVIEEVAKIDMTPEEVAMLMGELKSNPTQIAGYST